MNPPNLEEVSLQLSEVDRRIRNHDSELRSINPKAVNFDGDRFERIQRRLSDAEAERAAIQAKYEATVKAIDDLRRRKDELKINATSDVVAYHVKAMDKSESTIADLNGHRAEILARIESPPPPTALTELLTRRGDLTVRQLLGEPVEAELSEVEAKIREVEAISAQQRAKADSATAADRQTLGGIDRLLAKTNEELDRLQRAYPILFGHRLNAEIRDEAGRYEKVIRQAADQLLHITALERLRQRYAPGVRALVNLDFLAQCCFPMPTATPPVLDRLALIGHSGEKLDAVIQKEKDHLADIGIKVS